MAMWVQVRVVLWTVYRSFWLCTCIVAKLDISWVSLFSRPGIFWLKRNWLLLQMLWYWKRASSYASGMEARGRQDNCLILGSCWVNDYKLQDWENFVNWKLLTHDELKLWLSRAIHLVHSAPRTLSEASLSKVGSFGFKVLICMFVWCPGNQIKQELRNRLPSEVSLDVQPVGECWKLTIEVFWSYCYHGNPGNHQLSLMVLDSTVWSGCEYDLGY